MPPAERGGPAQSIQKGRLKPIRETGAVGNNVARPRYTISLHLTKQKRRPPVRAGAAGGRYGLSPEARRGARSFSASCDRSATRACAARPLQGHKKYRRSTSVRRLAAFSRRPARCVRGSAFSVRGLSCFRHPFDNAVNRGLMTRRKDGWRRRDQPFGLQVRSGGGDTPARSIRLAPRRPPGSVADPGMNTADLSHMGAPRGIASPGTAALRKTRSESAKGGCSGGVARCIARYNLLSCEGVAGSRAEEQFYCPRNLRPKPLYRSRISSSRTLFLPAQLRS